jgi:hypothetical protein
MHAQRSRPLSTLRASLTRHPSGLFDPAERYLLRFVILVAVVSAGGCASQASAKHQRLELGRAGLSSLSGDWAGTMETTQAGKCSIGERTDKRWQRAQIDQNEVVHVLVETDGTIRAHRYLKDGTLAPASAWWGSVSESLEVTAEQDSKAECQDAKSEVMTRLRGQFDRGPKGPALELAGLEKTCPRMGCEFNIVYRLTKK